MNERSRLPILLSRSTNVSVCTVPGTVYVHDRSQEFFSASFSACDEGSYSVGNGSSLRPGATCQLCPFGVPFSVSFCMIINVSVTVSM